MGMEMEIAMKLETKMTRLTAAGCAAMITSRESISLLLLMGIFQRGKRVAFWSGEALFPKGNVHGRDRVLGACRGANMSHLEAWGRQTNGETNWPSGLGATSNVRTDFLGLFLFTRTRGVRHQTA